MGSDDNDNGVDEVKGGNDDKCDVCGDNEDASDKDRSEEQSDGVSFVFSPIRNDGPM